jgi:hypothetical protein
MPRVIKKLLELKGGPAWFTATFEDITLKVHINWINSEYKGIGKTYELELDEKGNVKRILGVVEKEVKEYTPPKTIEEFPESKITKEEEDVSFL